MRTRSWGFILGGLFVALLLAGVVSNYASSHPDGLDSSLLKGCTVDADGNITGGSCPAQRARDHELADSPLAHYGIRGIDNRFLSTGLSGVTGVLLTFAIGGGVFWLVRRRGPERAEAGADDTACTDDTASTGGTSRGGADRDRTDDTAGKSRGGAEADRADANANAATDAARQRAGTA